MINTIKKIVSLVLVCLFIFNMVSSTFAQEQYDVKVVSRYTYKDDNNNNIEYVAKENGGRTYFESYRDGKLLVTTEIITGDNGKKSVKVSKNGKTEYIDVNKVARVASDISRFSINESHSSLGNTQNSAAISSSSYITVMSDAPRTYYYDLTDETYNYYKSVYYGTDLCPACPQMVDTWYIKTFDGYDDYTINAYRKDLITIVACVLAALSLPSSLMDVVVAHTRSFLAIFAAEIIDDVVMSAISPTYAARVKEYQFIYEGRVSQYPTVGGGGSYNIVSRSAGKYLDKTYYEGVTPENFDPINNEEQLIQVRSAL